MRGLVPRIHVFRARVIGRSLGSGYCASALAPLAHCKKYQKEKKYGGTQRCRKQKPARLAEQCNDRHEINEIATCGGIEHPGQVVVGSSRDRGKQRSAAMPEAHLSPIYEAGRSQGSGNCRSAEQQWPSRG